jgi:hypothetical protein
LCFGRENDIENKNKNLARHHLILYVLFFGKNEYGS